MESRDYDLILECGTLIDGAGAPLVSADIGILEDKIAGIGDLSNARADRRIDLEGSVICPGFIDLHTHTDATILSNPLMDSGIHQGVTTELGGNCGLSCGLCPAQEMKSSRFAHERSLYRGKEGLRWNALSEFLDEVENQGISGNFATLAGHGTIRKRSMGDGNRRPSLNEMEKMKFLLADAMEAGAFGLSTGLEYAPGRDSEIEELVELARVSARYDGLYATHLRNEAEGLIDGVDEALEIGRKAEIAVQLSHLKAEGRKNWGSVNRALERIDEATNDGIDAAVDQYPYTAYMTGMWLRVLPEWLLRFGLSGMAERINDPDLRPDILRGIRDRQVDWDLMTISICPKNRSLQGRTIAEIARERGVPPEILALELLGAGGDQISVTTFDMDEADVREVIRHPLVAIASDGSSTTAMGRLGEDRCHPRSYGTFPRALGRYARDLGAITLEEAVRKMTSLPASRLGLKNRGIIDIGAYADLVVFDPDRIIDTATFEEPRRYPQGIRYVFVNGETVVDHGRHTGARPGRVLRRGES